LRAARSHSLFIAAGQHFATSALTPAIFLRGERLRFLFMAPFSQMLVPPQNPVWFTELMKMK
ncbi:hypothetical protein, partial [Noviherbaspirillum galbum]|uniref:hypothetical protein n=1 Tax=Noviherbaspirillum galbum TaxID=2709383 RepID=UPI001969F62B